MVGVVQSRADVRKRVIDYRMHFARDAAGRFLRIQNQRTIKLILPKLRLQRRIFSEQILRRVAFS